MGRPRSFDESVVIAAASRLFLERGYEATSIDDLVLACGLHRGSLYKAFGSKRGIFLAVLQCAVRELPAAFSARKRAATDALDLVLIAALELAPRDVEMRRLVEAACVALSEPNGAEEGGEPAALLGRRLLRRAGIKTAQIRRIQPDS